MNEQGARAENALDCLLREARRQLAAGDLDGLDNTLADARMQYRSLRAVVAAEPLVEVGR